MTAPAPLGESSPSAEPATTGDVVQAGTGRYEPNPLNLLRVPQDDWKAAASVIERNFQAIAAHFRSLGGGSIGMAGMAKTFGWGHFRGAVTQASDTRFSHNLGRIPERIVHMVDLDGKGNAVQGDAAAANGTNVTRWSATEIYVRARDADGNFEFMVI